MFKGLYSIVVAIAMVATFSAKAADVRPYQDGASIVFEVDGDVSISKDGAELKFVCGMFKDMSPVDGKNVYLVTDLESGKSTDVPVEYDASLISDIAYPNPSTGTVNFRKAGFEKIELIGNGIAMRTEENSMDISSLPAGVYVIRMYRGSVLRFQQKLIKL